LQLGISGFLKASFIENRWKRIRREDRHVTINGSIRPQVRQVLHCTGRWLLIFV